MSTEVGDEDRSSAFQGSSISAHILSRKMRRLECDYPGAPAWAGDTSLQFTLFSAQNHDFWSSPFSTSQAQSAFEKLHFHSQASADWPPAPALPAPARLCHEQALSSLTLPSSCAPGPTAGRRRHLVKDMPLWSLKCQPGGSSQPEHAPGVSGGLCIKYDPLQ